MDVIKVQIELAILCTVVGGVIGYLTFMKNRDKDVRNDAAKDAKFEVKLDNISQGVDNINLALKEQSNNIDSLKERVIIIDQSAKSAHKRLDEFLNKKEDKENG